METKREKIGILEEVESGRRDSVYEEVRETEARIEEIEKRNATAYITTKGIIVVTFLAEYRFPNLAEAREVFATVIDALVY